MAELTYVYDPTPDKPWFAEGVTKGYLVVRGGWLPDGEAQVADAVVLVDEEGFVAIEPTSEFRPTRVVVDDS